MMRVDAIRVVTNPSLCPDGHARPRAAASTIRSVCRQPWPGLLEQLDEPPGVVAVDHVLARVVSQDVDGRRRPRVAAASPPRRASSCPCAKRSPGSSRAVPTGRRCAGGCGRRTTSSRSGRRQPRDAARPGGRRDGGQVGVPPAVARLVEQFVETSDVVAVDHVLLGSSSQDVADRVAPPPAGAGGDPTSACLQLPSCQKISWIIPSRSDR